MKPTRIHIIHTYTVSNLERRQNTSGLISLFFLQAAPMALVAANAPEETLNQSINLLGG